MCRGVEIVVLRVPRKTVTKPTLQGRVVIRQIVVICTAPQGHPTRRAAGRQEADDVFAPISFAPIRIELVREITDKRVVV